MSADEILQCQKPLSSTEPIDDFLFKNHYRSEKNRDVCREYLKELKDSCYSLAPCCKTAIQSCEDQLNSSQLQDRLRESIERLTRRHNECEKSMIETLKLF
ncbi:CPW-WPC domain protein, partial [Cooperia oncophora]